MQELKEKYNISETFYKRYIEENAKKRLGTEMTSFLLFKKGKFINPMKKNEILKKYIEEEIENFYEKKLINIPQIEFCVTTKCTLKCKDCCALMPKFNHHNHINMSFEDFKLYLDNLLKNVETIRNFVLLGGETLINPELPKMIDYACKQEKVFIIQLITNGTMKFSDELIETLKQNNKRIYVYISNYSINENLKPILKHEEIIQKLKENEIKYQIVDNKEWVKELEFDTKKSSNAETSKKMIHCFRTQCNQVLNGYLDICSKAASIRELGILKIEDSVNIVESKNLKQDLIDFYQKDVLDACSYCILNDEKILPAIQLED